MSKNSGVLTQLWAAEPAILKTYLETIGSATAEQMSAAVDIFAEQTAEEILTIEGDTAYIEITGILNPDGPAPIDRLFGIDVTGFNQIRDAIDIVAANDDIKTVRLMMDTPGGTIIGTDETYQSILALSLKKKVIAENYGLMASAGYWLAVAADEIVAMSPTVQTGSIGVRFAGYDWSKFLENAGIKQVVILSANAPAKGRTLADKETLEEIQRRVDALERVFIARVAAGRRVSMGKVKSDFGRGAVLIAEDPQVKKPDAFSVGMIDSVVAALAGNPKDKHREPKSKSTASGGNHTMTLTELLAGESAARVEYDSALDAKFKEGQEAGFSEGQKATEEKIAKRISAAEPYMSSEDYPDSIRQLAAKVACGKADPSALEAAVTVLDAVKETAASDKAAADSETLTETPGQETEAKSDDGLIRSDADVQQEGARLRGGIGDGSGGK